MAARTGIRFPVPIRVYDQTIEVMKSAIGKAKLGQSEELAAIRRLDDQTRQLDAPPAAAAGTRWSPTRCACRRAMAGAACSAGRPGQRRRIQRMFGRMPADRG